MSGGVGHAARTFATFTRDVRNELPVWLARLVPATFIGFAVINLAAFGLDMLLLWLSHGRLGWPYPVAVSISYGAASVFAFVLNKWLNFQSHGFLGRQSSAYAVTAVSNYVIWILGFSWLLESLGVHYQVARVVSACIEGVYLYVLARFWVFRPR